MIDLLVDKFFPIKRDLKIGDRVTDSNRFGTVVDIVGKIYNVVQWDNNNCVVHVSNELKITRKRKK